MQNVGQSEKRNVDKVNVQLDVVKSSTPHSSASSPAKSESETYSGAPAKYMTDSSESEDDSVSEAEMDEEGAGADASKFLAPNDSERNVDPEMQARLEALLEAAGIGKLSGEGKHLADPEVLRRLTSSVSCALDEAAAALTRMRSDQPPAHNNRQDKPTQCVSTGTTTTTTATASVGTDGVPSLAEACSDGDVGTVRKLLTEGRSVHETTEEGESLLSLACSAGYYELAQVLLAMHASVEDRGIKGDCTPLMEAASAGHVDIVKLLIKHDADVNAISVSGNTSLMYACSGGHVACVQALLDSGANVEDHNENGHTPLMEAASAGHVGVAKILLEHGAGINTHSNEFKESALTLACYKGHLDMVRFLLAAGADREHKTDEMHTALMEASMDGHVEVARLLLDSGAQVNMPTDSFESPLTLAACGGHVELAMLLLERGANIEEVNDEGYTPLMEAAREGHEEMVALLLGQGASINAQTEETQETALTLACCGGFLEVADFLIKAGADVELGASTPLMEASQEGHLELVRFLLNAGAKVHAQTQTGDTALTYACENGHTDVADLLLRYGADLEHESEGGRTPLMKACRAGHSCTVQYLIGKGADVNRMTANGDHTPLSLACAGGHAEVVKFLLLREADPFLKLKDNSSTLIEAAKGGHTEVVELLLDLPRSLMREVAITGKEGLSIAQAAQLGLVHMAAPGETVPTLLPYPPPPPTTEPPPSPQPQQPNPTYTLHKVFSDGSRKKPNPSCGTKPAGPTCTSSMKHKCCRKSRAAPPQADHHLPPPPDILEQQWLELTNEEREEMALAITSPPPDQIETPGPPTLVTSALQALDLQFCAQGVTTTGFPAQQQFPVPQLPPSVEQQKLQQLAQHRLILPLYEADQQRPEAFAPQAGAEASDRETRELTAVLAYLQREVPSLDALPRNELRSLVLEVMQQKNHEIGDKIKEIERDYRHAEEQGMVHGTLWGLLQRPSPAPAEGEPPIKPFTFPNVAYDETYRATTFPPPHMPTAQQPIPQVQPLQIPQIPLPQPQQPQMQQPQQPQMQQVPQVQQQQQQQPPLPPELTKPERKREQHTNTSVKKKARVVRRQAGAPVASYPVTSPPAPSGYCAMDVDGEIDSTHDTALTLACAGGHEDLVELLLARGADIEHRDKKGFTPLILAATAGHEKIVEILLNHGADIEAQSERTKDTPLSLACSGGRYDVVDLILSRGANKEHRNVSDYTPLSLAASGGYVNIIRMLLQHQAEINSRTGSKLGISPLMLAAMNGHTAAVRLLLDCGSDINAQIETNRNTALTLACFQGRHEVVSLLLDRKANVEHRAKTGLTPLMEAASGGYVEVGRVLLNKGADVNAPPVPSSRDTALTIAADKGHIKFVELLLQRKAAVEVKNKKGNSPLWLAANGGHLAVVEMLYVAGADIDSQDNRKVSCLMAAFRKGHTKVVKWMVGDVTQFPSDQEMTRYICTISDKELLLKCQECVQVIRAAKETQAARANQNATILLEELESERCREETRRQAAARRRERKKKKKMEKKEEKRKLLEENDKNSMYSEKGEGESEGGEQEEEVVTTGKEEGDSGIDANSQGSCSSSDVKAPPASSAKSKRKKKDTPATPVPATTPKKIPDKVKMKPEEAPKSEKSEKENVAPTDVPAPPSPAKSTQSTSDKRPAEKKEKQADEDTSKIIVTKHVATRKSQVFESTKINVEKDIDDKYTKSTTQWETEAKSTSPKGGCVGGRREEGWKEVVRKSSVQTLSTVEPGCKKVSVASHAISRVIGRAGYNINAIRSATGAHIEVDKQTKGQGERIITIKGSAEATKQAATLIASMIRDPDADISQLIPRAKLHVLMATPQPQQAKMPKQVTKIPGAANVSVAMPRPTVPTTRPVLGTVKPNVTTPRAPPPRLQSQAPTEKRIPPTTPTGVQCTPPKPTLSYTGAIVGSRSNTFASKLSATPGLVDVKTRTPSVPVTSSATPTTPTSARTPRESPPATIIAKTEEELLLQRSACHVQLSPESASSWSAAEDAPTSHSAALHINTTPQSSASTSVTSASGVSAEYSLFKDMNIGGGMWGTAESAHHNPEPLPLQVDASKAPGYRGGTAGGCSPCSRASSHGSTPPPNNYMEQSRHTQTPHQQRGGAVNSIDMSGLARNGPIYPDNNRNVHMQQVTMSSVGPVGSVGQPALGLNFVDSVSRLNPRAPDYCARPAPHHLHKHNAQLFGNPSASVGNLLMSYQQQQTHKPMHAPPQPTSLHHFHPLLDRGMAPVGAVGWGEEEERKPRPIGTERAWKMNATDEWHQPEHERFQTLGGVSAAGLDVGFGSSGPVGPVAGVTGVAGVSGLSLMHNLPVHFMTNATQHAEHHNWDHQHAPNEKPQNWRWRH